jgi:2',3'-cyclic-nucleotide 2'-phosphodiesterase (5'-nucleotidase family)
MGGLARRAAYIKAFKYRSNLEVPTLFVDAGNLFTDDRYVPGQLPSEVMTKNRWVVKSYGDFHHDAANISYNDLPYLGELLAKEGLQKRLEEYPFIDRLVSANVLPLDDKHTTPTPYVVKEITLKRVSPGKKLKIGIVGFTEGKPAGATERAMVYGPFRIEDPFEAAKRVLPELKSKVDFIIALAYMPQDMAQRLASENPEIDSIVGARQVNATEELQHFNRAAIAYAFNQTKYLGELRIYLNQDGSVSNQTNRYIALDSMIPDDAAALERVNQAHDEFTAEQNKNAQQAAVPVAQSTLLGGSSPYVGAESCKTCHEEQYRIWQGTGHAHAMATLERKNQQFDNECVRCHVVGFGKGGFQSLVTTPQYKDVQCEACHGPGETHIGKPQKGFGVMATPAGCVQCHTQPNSPDFNFETYWPKIKH